jgi:hypothetical protein
MIGRSSRTEENPLSDKAFTNALELEAMAASHLAPDRDRFDVGGASREVAKVEREATGIGPEELGLRLADGKTVLKQVQAGIVQIQIEAISAVAKAF